MDMLAAVMAVIITGLSLVIVMLSLRMHGWLRWMYFIPGAATASVYSYVLLDIFGIIAPIDYTAFGRAAVRPTITLLLFALLASAILIERLYHLRGGK